MKCCLCDREISKGDFCKYHEKAYESICDSYARWKEASEVGWKEYLREIAVNPLTGQWTKEVAQYLMRTEKYTNVEVS